MSAAPSLLLSLLTEQQDGDLMLDTRECCRFCGCTELAPCEIPLREEADGNFYLARNGEEATLVLACTWLAPRVCSAPACMEKLLLESRQRVLLFDGYGRRTGS